MSQHTLGPSPAAPAALAASPSELRAWLAGLSEDQRAQLLHRLRRETDGPSRPSRQAGRDGATDHSGATGLAGPTGSSGWFVRSGGTAPTLRLFCFAYAGGGTSVFRGWSERLPGGVEVCAVQLPGRETRSAEEPYRRMDALVNDLAAAVEPLLDRPFVLFGHSMGALVAFELTRRLRRDGARMPERLVLSAFRAPQLPNPNIRIHHLPEEVLRTVLAKDGTPPEVLRNEDLMRAMLPVLRADLEVCDTYEYVDEGPLCVPLTILGGLYDVRVSRSDLEHWETHAGAGHHLTMLPGSHLFVNEHRDLVLDRIAADLHPCALGEELTA